MRATESAEGRRDSNASVARESRRGASVMKGPGVAVRAPPGTKYLIYGLTVLSGGAPPAHSRASAKRGVYMSSLDADEEAAEGTSGAPASTAIGVSGGVPSVREHHRMMDMLAAMPLGDSPEERSTVRGYTWGGTVPTHVRPYVWRLLCGYIPCSPTSFSRQQAELRRKRQEYDNFVAKYYKITITDFIQPSTLRETELRRGMQSVGAGTARVGNSAETMPVTTATSASAMAMAVPPDDRAILSQIALDLPRHAYALFHLSHTASALARCLFLWSRRYPAVGYVQGIDDIMVVFFFVFLEGAFAERNMRSRQQLRENHAEAGDGDVQQAPEHAWIPASVVYSSDVHELGAAMEELPADLFKAAEADTYFCGGFFLSWLQDNFVHGQPGIMRSMRLMEALLRKVDFALLDSILSHGIRLMDCCFQWVHCLLARELPLELLVPLWEKYMAIGSSEMVLDFHSYVCVALMMQLRQKLLEKPLDVILQLLKDPLERRAQPPPPPPGPGADGAHNHAWLEALISTASQLFRDYPAYSLS
ncbi:putative TBC1 domain family member 22A [Trypanosoma conorhini]|uniref:Putative TBC1 domain family member 22A n=1 Tax=Trypanosoma conorhini TaxID=83891 RepID=A0A422QAS4_9TRYP|nr:putative TBC1 domain family member 22A [Trypanosoma conorhini]RNF27083.1 putative TBC1 domain family member 22A [Trypanosoma conorhini]